MRTFWALLFILLPLLLFSEGTLSSFQTVPIIAAFPIGIVIILAIRSFFRDGETSLRGARGEILPKRNSKNAFPSTSTAMPTGASA